MIGGGALGLAVAAELAARGAGTVVVDDGRPSASAGAAGMLAPAFETVLDPSSAGHARLLSEARDLWPDFARRRGVTLHREGAEWRGPDPADILERLRAAGFGAERAGESVFTPDDWRLEPDQALKALGRAGGPRVTGRATALTSQGVVLEDRQVIEAGAVVLAGGWLACPEGTDPVPPVTPIRGQAVRIEGPSPERVLRGPGIYIAPAPGGAVIGATMEEGRTDPEPDVAVTETLLARARAIWPVAEGARSARAYVGVRGASPDGLPYAGQLRTGLFCALAPRRNGWLLAPMVAEITADAVEGRGPGPWAAAMDPGRAAPNPRG